MTDLIIHNARVLTMDPEHPRAEAVAVQGNTIRAVGMTSEVMALATSQTKLIDAAGRSVLPGFIDSHVHLFQGSAELDFLPVGGMKDLVETAESVHNYANARPNEPLILGVGALYELFGEHDTYPRLLLDEMISDRPLALIAADLHTVWANTCALEATQLLRGAEMPDGSKVEMGDDGLATGVLQETGAFGPVLALSRTGGRDMQGYVTGDDPNPPATKEQREADKDLLVKGIDHVAAHGITTLHNMDGNFYQLELLSELEAEGRLNARVQIPMHLKNFDSLDRLQEAAEMHRRYAGDKIWSGRVKMFMDGVLENRTALKTRGYPDTPNTLGEAIFAPDHFNEACRIADSLGLQISVHAVGDLAVSRVLDGYKYAQDCNGSRDARHRIEHIEVISESDIARMKELNAVASMQPRHASFAGFFDPPEPNTILFNDECKRAYAWQTLRQEGIPLAFSTDWPVVPISALANIQCAVAPANLGPNWPSQSQNLEEALKSYTSINAWMAFKENDYGRIQVGLFADLILLDGDIESCALADLENLNVALTMCDGQITYER